MAEIKTGGPAFPLTRESSMSRNYEGMSLRDWFAGQALPVVIDSMQSGAIGDHAKAGGGPPGFAATAYDIADAMLAARGGNNG